MELDRSYKVYIHTSPCNKKYVGITRTTPKRRWGNGGHYKHNRYFTFAIKKYGWENFQHEVVLSGLTREEAIEKEIELIAKYKSNDKRYGYNLSGGGEGASHFSEEARRRISEGNKGIKRSDEFKKRVSEVHTGAVFSLERRKKISEALTGRKLTEEHIQKCREAHLGEKGQTNRPINQYSLDGIFIKRWDYMKLAKDALGIKASSNLTMCCRGITRTCYGYKWEYAD